MNWVTVSILAGYAIAALLIVPTSARASKAGNTGSMKGSDLKKAEAQNYERKEVRIHNGPRTLSGTLTLPTSDPPYLCVVLQGAGSQPGLLDAADTWAPIYFNKMANELARGGIATLWYHMRSADLTHKEYLKYTLEDFADDVLAAVRFLQQRSEIDSSHIGLGGLSEGGWTVALAASRSNKVDFLILLDSPSLRVEEGDRLQMQAMGRARGATEEEIREMYLRLKRIYQASRSEKVDEDLETGIRKQATETIKNLPEEQRPPVDSFVQAQINRILSPNFRYLLDFEPEAVFGKIHCPTLALFAESDNVVPVEKHGAAMKAAFQSGGNTGFSIHTISEASHIFTEVKAGPPELIPSKIVFAPGFPDVLVDWILQLK